MSAIDIRAWSRVKTRGGHSDSDGCQDQRCTVLAKNEETALNQDSQGETSAVILSPASHVKSSPLTKSGFIEERAETMTAMT